MKDSFQAIIVLGRGIDLEGNLPANARTRVERAVSLYEKNPVPVVFCGVYTYRYVDPVPPRTEAAAMAEYAVSLGLPESAFLLEETSKDTIGNAIFAKKQCVAPNGWTSLCIVTSIDHAMRTEYIFNKIFGPGYALRFEACPVVLTNEATARATAREKKSLDITKELLEPVRDGDDARFDYLVENVLIAYAKHPPISREELGKMLGD